MPPFQTQCTQFVNVRERSNLQKSSMALCSVSTMVLPTTVAIFLSWLLFLTSYASTSDGTFTSLTNLPNSKGELCGEGKKNGGRENLLYFDLSRCAGLRADTDICRTNKVGMIMSITLNQWTPCQAPQPSWGTRLVTTLFDHICYSMSALPFDQSIYYSQLQ